MPRSSLRFLPWLSLATAIGACADPCLDDGLLQDTPQDCAANNGSTSDEPTTGAEQSCFNGQADPDETDIDCGGVCEAQCGVGQGCVAPEDCDTSICGDDGACAAPAACNDGTQDPGESDEDCGGVCGSTCPIDADCEVFLDCEQLVCDADTGLCAAPTCDDGAPNGGETDVDCGGPDCEPCLIGGSCDNDDDCASGSCDPEAGVCVAEHCTNGESDASETDVDCGGPECAPCDEGGSCEEGSDCSSTLCEGDVCAAASCDDGVRNGSESDIDCGGNDCDPCADGQSCEDASDCASELCDPLHEVCEAESCTNGIADGDETDIDCGGPSCAPCNDGEGCDMGSDCASESCASGTCGAPTCADGLHNGTESDVDCGGDDCDPCDTGAGCLLESDCVSTICLAEECQPPSCTDGVQNGDETDADCGGACGDTCEVGEDCNDEDDCSSQVCGDDGTCQEPSCGDGALNGDETDVDCGGEDCDPCDAPGTCELDTDCSSAICDDGTCAPATCRDGVENGSETDVDCGGDDCGPCDDGEGCDLGDDCSSLVCTDDTCAAPTCDDGVQNQDETDADCGGLTCGPCDDGEGCALAADCSSLVCDPVAMTCESALCNDGVQNGGETDLDCGGPSCSGCDTDEDCVLDGDCTSNVCDDATNTCNAPVCDDGVTNGTETDVDCGGDTCAPCDDGETCEDADDCSSVVCLATVCQPSACGDGVQNGDETDTDCGGSCQPCDDGEGCDDADDCTSLNCGAGGTCTAPTCGDGIQNQGETDQDCGGPNCGPCDDGEGCDAAADCTSVVCDAVSETCTAPTCSDGVQNQDETDDDCGGSCGSTCDTGEDCDGGGDCLSLVCDGLSDTCSAPTCGDGVRNGNETDADCGGSCGATCDTGEDCNGDGDCESLNCDDGTNTCTAPSCGDGIQNQGESDVDCGNVCGNTCEVGESCDDGADCAEGVCDALLLTCSAPTCFDGVANGDETDEDCGNSCAADCDNGEGCDDASDCTSMVCDGATDTCTAPSCGDGIQNGDESDVDCGGSCGNTCDPGDSCNDADDCLSSGCLADNTCNALLDVSVTPNACADASGGPVSYTAVATGGTGGPYTFAWTPDDGTVVPANAASVMITPADYASYTVTASDGVNQTSSVALAVLSNQPFNLQNNCTQYGTGNIVYSEGGTVATETINGGVAIHLCEEVSFTNVRLTGGFEVRTTGDDDWGGFLWGAQSSGEFYSLSWKQAPQAFLGCTTGDDPAGVTVKRVFADSFASMSQRDLYCPEDTANSEILLTPAQALSTGWADNTPYTIEIEFRPTGSDITITNDNTSAEVASFSISDTTYTEGFFGTHTLSQDAAAVGPLFGECL